MAVSITILTKSDTINQIVEDKNTIIDECKNALVELNSASFEYIQKHKDYIENTVMDESMIKDRMKRKVKEVFRND